MLLNVDEGWWRLMRPHRAMWHGIDMLKTCYKMWLLPSHHGNPKIHSECTSLWIHGHSPRWDDAWNVDELIRNELRIPIISQPSIYDHLWICMDMYGYLWIFMDICGYLWIFYDHWDFGVLWGCNSYRCSHSFNTVLGDVDGTTPKGLLLDLWGLNATDMVNLHFGHWERYRDL